MPNFLNFKLRKIALFSLAIAGSTLSTTVSLQAKQADKSQLVIISFDGAHDNALWARSREMGQKYSAQFTYFISCTFLLTRAQAKEVYNPPRKGRGASNIGFAKDEKDIMTRLNHIWRAKQEGHEIGSHACGHFDGSEWSKQDWAMEFDAFDQITRNAWSHAGRQENEPKGWDAFIDDGIKGFRAPYLSTNKALFRALTEHEFTYDASLVSMGPQAHDDQSDVIKFSLPLIPEGPSGRPLIAMDYNFYMRHSKAQEMPARADEFETRTFDALQKAFDAQYDGTRVPLQIGYHFVEMNNGAYWNALETFIATNCVKQDVDCISYEAAIDRFTHRAETN